ncbi:MAG TPA: GNAT family N-acetyltransferase [Acetobacteraceae bacterium]|nr:GNAT family N-acetyltransferase [Acetobacteraceae bacterium]
MRSADPVPRIETFASLDALPDDVGPLFAAAGSFFATRAWWEAVLSHAIPPNARPRLVLIRHLGLPWGLFPMLYDPAGAGFGALTTPYTCLYEPLIAFDRAELFAAFARYCRSFPTTRLDALDPSAATQFAAGAKRAGLFAARFDHFGNWYEDVSGLDWDGWLARRPGALRETIRRRTRRAEQIPAVRFRLFDQQNDLAGGIDAFETVYARSWKDPEPYPAFNPAQIRAAASLGVARVGVWWIGETPAAAQFWIVEQGRATVLKLAHDESFKEHSPGTVLTAWMIRHMIEQAHVSELDFGRGDDPYKRDWVGFSRQRMGVLLINPRHPLGLLALARHAVGRVTARLRNG